MMSPRSYLLAYRQHPPPAAPSTSPPSSPPSYSYSSSPSSPSTPASSPPTYNFALSKRDFAAATTATFAPIHWSPKYDQSSSSDITVTISPVRPTLSDATMGKRKDRRETSSLSPSSPPKTTTHLTTRPTTPTSPVKIPNNPKREVAHPPKRHSSHSQHSRRRDVHSPESLSPSLAALLAVTDIPRPRQMQRRRRRSEKPLTLDEMIASQRSEKDLSWSLSRNPLDLLLSPPEEMQYDDDSVSECNIGSALSTRTLSVDSIPSLGDSVTSDPFSFDTPRTPSPYRGRRLSPMRKSLEPIISPPGSVDEHPLAGESMDVDEIDFRVFERPENDPPKSQFFQPFKPLKSAFKSNLTASLRALRSAAKSFSAINLPSIPPDDFLTRSILTIDPNVPYTDERRPPASQDIPSAAMRRYLNPTSNARIETPPSKVTAGTFGASIQMRTYKIQRSQAPASAPNLYPSTSLQTSPEPQPQQPATNQAATTTPPAVRQREMRENSDFIRIAVMEMAMRKRGKLDDQRPGRARWALPPRKMSAKPYEMTADGIPVRWVPVNY